MHSWGNKQVSWVDHAHKVHSPVLLCYKISQWYREENAADKATSDGEGALPTSPPILKRGANRNPLPLSHTDRQTHTRALENVIKVACGQSVNINI